MLWVASFTGAWEHYVAHGFHGRSVFRLLADSSAIFKAALHLLRTQSQYADDPIPVLTVAERSRTVNARGQYVDHRYGME